MRRFASFSIVLFALGVCAPAMASQRSATPSGLPVPRFASLKYDETNCRAGPSLAHAVIAAYRRRGQPVLVVAETLDHWRKIRDVRGAECWMHKAALRGATHALTLKEVDLKAGPNQGAPTRARLAAGVVARLSGQKNEWRRISASGLSGWVRAEDLWGAMAP